MRQLDVDSGGGIGRHRRTDWKAAGEGLEQGEAAAK